jgi:glycosyltransferase involved in cell wall biosynthesis
MNKKILKYESKKFKNSISIITACLNPNLNELKTLYKSIINQTYLPLEWIIIDGGSDSKTINEVEKYKKDSSFKISLLLCEGTTIYSALNIGISKSKSDFYLVAGCDDILDKDCIYNYSINLSPKIDFLVSQVKKNGKKSNLYKKKFNFFQYYGSTKIITNHSLGLLIKKELHKKIGYYDPSFIVLSDTKFIIKAHIKKYNFEYFEFTAGDVGCNGISRKKRLLAYMELFRIIKELNFNKFLNILILFLRLIRY